MLDVNEASRADLTPKCDRKSDGADQLAHADGFSPGRPGPSAYRFGGCSPDIESLAGREILRFPAGGLRRPQKAFLTLINKE